MEVCQSIIKKVPSGTLTLNSVCKKYAYNCIYNTLQSLDVIIYNVKYKYIIHNVMHDICACSFYLKFYMRNKS